jgi:Zn-dependent protease/CBS domain-containing protein
MGRGFSIGHIFGIDIRIDWSWLVIFLLVTWNLWAVFGSIHSNWGEGLRWGLAISAALLFFASVLVHELAHSLVAKSQGTEVRSIMLFLFGGVSNIQREPKSPGNEFSMAIVGPLSSIIIGVVLVGIVLLGFSGGTSAANTTQLLGSLSPVPTLLLWLGSVNVTVGLFNLVPGFPLDGGRVLRSILWAISKNLRRATRWASWVGQGIAWLMILGGIAMVFGVRIPVFGTGFVSGLWLAFIGWFLNNASSQSYQQVVIQDILGDVPVSRIMRTDPPTCSADCSVERLVHDHIMQSDDQSFPILEDGTHRLAGLVTLDDVRGISRDVWETTRVADIMTPASKLVVVGPNDDAAEALGDLTGQDVRQLPVVENGDLVGLLRRRDIVKWLQLHSEQMGRS